MVSKYKRRWKNLLNTPLLAKTDSGDEEGLIPLFLANREGDNRTQATISYYRQRLIFFYNWLLDNGYEGILGDFQLDTVNSYVRWMQEKEVKFEKNPFTQPRPGRLSSVYIRNNVRVLKTFSVWLAEYEYNRDDVLAKRKVPKTYKKEIQILQKWEIEKLLSVVDRRDPLGVRDLAIIWTFLDTGIRLSELANLSLDAVDFRAGYLHIKGKGQKERSVPFGATTKKWLMLYRDRYRPQRLSARFFLLRDGSTMTTNAIGQMVKKHSRKAGIERIHPHLFRHTYATNYLRQHPGDLFRLQMNLGHETLDILRIYVHLANLEDAKELREASVMDRMEIRITDSKRREAALTR